MEIKIGMQNVGREIVLDSDQNADEIAAAVAAALKDATQLRLIDHKGRQVIVPAPAIAYVEIGAEEARRIGFGAL